MANAQCKYESFDGYALRLRNRSHRILRLLFLKERQLQEIGFCQSKNISRIIYESTGDECFNGLFAQTLNVERVAAYKMFQPFLLHGAAARVGAAVRYFSFFTY